MSPRIAAFFSLTARVLFSLVVFNRPPLRVPAPGHHAPVLLLHVVGIVLFILAIGVLLGVKARFCAIISAGLLAITAWLDPSVWPAVELSGALLIAFAGSGAFSLDRAFSRWLDAFFRVRYTDIIDYRAQKHPERDQLAASDTGIGNSLQTASPGRSMGNVLSN